MSEQRKETESNAKRRAIKVSAGVAVGTTVFLAFRELSRRHLLTTEEALEKALDPASLQHRTRVRILAALLNQPCMVNEQLRQFSGEDSVAKFEQALQALTDYQLDKHALIRSVESNACTNIVRAHYELTPFANDAWEGGKFGADAVIEIMAFRDEFSDNS